MLALRQQLPITVVNSEGQFFPKKIVANRKYITNIESTVINFNNFLTKVGPNLAQKLVSSNKHFNDYLLSCLFI